MEFPPLSPLSKSSPKSSESSVGKNRRVVVKYLPKPKPPEKKVGNKAKKRVPGDRNVYDEKEEELCEKIGDRVKRNKIKLGDVEGRTTDLMKMMKKRIAARKKEMEAEVETKSAGAAGGHGEGPGKSESKGPEKPAPPEKVTLLDIVVGGRFVDPTWSISDGILTISLEKPDESDHWPTVLETCEERPLGVD